MVSHQRPVPTNHKQRRGQDIVHVASTCAAKSDGARSPLAGAISTLAPRGFPHPVAAPRRDATIKYQLARRDRPARSRSHRLPRHRKREPPYDDDDHHGARLHLRHRVRGRAQDALPRGEARARQCRRRRRRQARAAPRARRVRQEVVDPGLQERRRVHQPAMARWLVSSSSLFPPRAAAFCLSSWLTTRARLVFWDGQAPR